MKKASPWFDSNNENVFSFRRENPKNYEPNNGWTLIQRDFGEPGRFINHPYFILYNRYTGILRIFVAISETVAGYNKAVIKLRFRLIWYQNLTWHLKQKVNQYLKTLSGETAAVN